MQKNYSTLPFKNFNCSQNYVSTPQDSHYKQSHSTNGVLSYPIDVLDDIYCGCDEMKVVRINGVGNGTINQIFVQSTAPVIMPIGTNYITYLITHPNDADIINSNLSIGTTFHRGQLIIHQGTDGGVPSHIDLVIAKSLQSGWVTNSYGELVLPDSIKPEEGFYLDKSFTDPNIYNPLGIVFQDLPSDAYISLPTPVTRDEGKNQVQVICAANTLNVYSAASPTSSVIGYATPGIYNIVSTIEADGYIWYQVEEGKWFANIEGCTKELLAVPLIMPLVSVQESYDNLPLGTQICFSGSNIPKSYLICDGSEVSREEYSELFSVIGTIYGEGDGSLTFNIPDKKGRVSVGFSENEKEFNEIGKTGGHKALQSHTHSVNANKTAPSVFNQSPNSQTQALNINEGTTVSTYWAHAGSHGSRNVSTAGTGDSENIQPYQVDVWIIKAKRSIDSILVEGQVIDGFGSLSTVDACSARNATELYERIIGKVLYNSSTGTIGNVILSETSENFDYIEVFFRDQDNLFSSVKIHNPNGKYFTMNTTGIGIGIIAFRTKAMSISGTSISYLDGYTQIFTNGISSGYNNSNTYIYITRIMGYK